MINKITIQSKNGKQILLISENNISYENNINFIGTYKIIKDVLIIKWENNITMFFIKNNNDDIYCQYYFDNFDLKYYKSKVNNMETNDWVEAMEHWIIYGRLNNIEYCEKGKIMINGELLNIYINYSHMNIIDYKNNKKYIFYINNDIYNINLNPFNIENGKIIFLTSYENNIKKYIKQNDIYKDIDYSVDLDINIKIQILYHINNSKKCIIYYSKKEIKLLEEQLDIFKYLDNSYIKVVLTYDNVINYENEYNILKIPYMYRYFLLSIKNILIYFDDHTLYNDITTYKNINNKILYKLEYNKNNTYNLWNKQLNIVILNSNIIIYDNINLNNFLNKINCTKDYYYIDYSLNNKIKSDKFLKILNDI